MRSQRDSARPRVAGDLLPAARALGFPAAAGSTASPASAALTTSPTSAVLADGFPAMDSCRNQSSAGLRHVSIEVDAALSQPFPVTALASFRRELAITVSCSVSRLLVVRKTAAQ